MHLMHLKSNTPNAQRLKLSIRCQTLPRPVRRVTIVHVKPEFCFAQCEVLPGFAAMPEFGPNAKWRLAAGRQGSRNATDRPIDRSIDPTIDKSLVLTIFWSHP